MVGASRERREILFALCAAVPYVCTGDQREALRCTGFAFGAEAGCPDDKRKAWKRNCQISFAGAYYDSSVPDTECDSFRLADLSFYGN